MSEKAVVEKMSEKTTAEKISAKVAEKRRALGRGLESLLPGPRVVAVPSPAPQNAGAESGRAETSVAAPAVVDLRAAAEAGDGRAGAAVPTQAAMSSQASVPTPAPVNPLATGVDLHASVAGATPGGEGVVWLAIDSIERNPHQTRADFRKGLDELADSIKVQGLLQPIVVRPGKDGCYTLILGERRLRASLQAGLETIPAIVRRVSEQQAAEMTLVENLQRQDLNCVEQADAFARLSKDFHLTQEEIGERVGVSRETVANYMRLLTLPEGVLEALIGGRLTFSHARALMRLTDHVQIWGLARKAIEEKMSVAKLDDLITGKSAPPGFAETERHLRARWVDPNVKAAQRSLEEVLGMRVRIRDRNGRGKILIEYATLEDFDRVVGMLGGSRP